MLELCDYNSDVLRERRRLQFAQRIQCRCLHANVGVRKQRDQGVDVVRKRRRLQLAKGIQCLSAHVPLYFGVREYDDYGANVLCERLCERRRI